jgi:hypothetical protein
VTESGQQAGDFQLNDAVGDAAQLRVASATQLGHRFRGPGEVDLVDLVAGPLRCDGCFDPVSNLVVTFS